MNNYDFIEMSLPAKADYIGVARLSLSGIANRMGFSYDDIEDLKVAVSEALTNSVAHAYGEDTTQEIKLGFGIYEDRLEVIVSDKGESFNYIEIKDEIGPYQGNERVEELRENGFGLFLIDALMDEIQINNKNGVVVLMTKYMNEVEVDADDDQISTT